MDLEQIKRIKTKEKKSLIREICLMYKKILKSRTIVERARLSVSDSVKSPSRLLNQKSISIFHTIIELLPEEQKEIIGKDFIKEEEPYWYISKYSKTKYYKLKNEAMNNFLFLFYK